MAKGKNILDNERFTLTIDRLCRSLIEKHDNFDNTCIIGIQQRGVLFAQRLIQRLETIADIKGLDFGKLDITFFRDDFRRREIPLQASATEINFLLEDKRVVLVDDVLYTGRTIHAAISAIHQYGRPQLIELMVMVDRRFNRHYPIQSDYTGITVDALNEAYVKVEWKEDEGEDKVLFFSAKRLEQ